LDLLVRVGEIKGWRRQQNIHLHGLNGLVLGAIRVDFELTHNNNAIEIVEYKGFKDPTWWWKWKMLVTEYAVERPGVVFAIVWGGPVKRIPAAKWGRSCMGRYSPPELVRV
jgi:hypothetical protein